MTQQNKLICSKEAFIQHNILNLTPQYLQPDYFLCSNNSYLGKKYNKVQQRISRIISATLLSGLVLTASVGASASSNTEVLAFPYMQDHGTYDHHTSENIFEDVVKKKSLIRRAEHKVAKRLGSLEAKAYGTSLFNQPHSSNQSNSLDQPSIIADGTISKHEAIKYLGDDAVLNIASDAIKDPDTSKKLYKLGTKHPEYVVADVLKGITKDMMIPESVLFAIGENIVQPALDVKAKYVWDPLQEKVKDKPALSKGVKFFKKLDVHPEGLR